MNTDDPPTVEVKTEPLELDTPCEPECYFDNSMAEWGVLIRRPRYRFQIDIDDDRPPRPQSPRYIEVCAGQGKTRLVPEAEDCLGQIMPFSVTAPDLASWRSFLRMCPEGQFCEDAECRPREAPEPPPPEEIDEGVGEEVPESEELDDPLPVEIVSFEAETPSPKVKRGQCVEVTWEAPGATNVYIIEIDSLGIETKRWHNLPASGKDCLYPDEMPRGQNVFWRLYAWGVADDAWVESWPIVVELE
jgi:hypothetical protein